ncbi:hypothetical protein AB0I55_29350 [Actinocatenispora sera]|uniref:hypothetical protein n=1 Tax=Actinocatenispora sera TaxID=390989 RepID=UPI0033FD615F
MTTTEPTAATPGYAAAMTALTSWQTQAGLPPDWTDGRPQLAAYLTADLELAYDEASAEAFADWDAGPRPNTHWAGLHGVAAMCRAQLVACLVAMYREVPSPAYRSALIDLLRLLDVDLPDRVASRLAGTDG